MSTYSIDGGRLNRAARVLNSGSASPSEAREVLREILGHASETPHTSDILNAYDAFEGDDVGTFTAAWDEYLAGTDTPCTAAADGLHYDPEGFGRGACALCGKVGRA